MFGTLDLVVDETGLAGPLSLLPSDAVMSFPRLAFLLPPSVDDNGDFSMASEPEAAIAWTIAGKWTAEADRKRSRLVGTVATPNGTARLRFDILLDEHALPLTAVLARRGDDQEAEFTLKRR